MSNSKKNLIGLVYRSPASTEAANDELCTLVKQFGVCGNCDKLLLDDLVAVNCRAKARPKVSVSDIDSCSAEITSWSSDHLYT